MRAGNFHRTKKDTDKPVKSVVRKFAGARDCSNKEGVLMPEKLDIANRLISGVPLPKEFNR